MSPHLPDGMENPSTSNSPGLLRGSINSCKMSLGGESLSTSLGVSGSIGILLDDESLHRSSNSPSLPSLSGLPLRIRSASLPALIELCIMCFDDDGVMLEAAANYPNIFFLMHKWFATSESLAHDMRQLFKCGRPSYHFDYTALLTSIQPNPNTNSGDGVPSCRPSSVVMSRKQDDYNGNIGLRSPSLVRRLNDRSNSVLIPRPACIGVEDDNYFSYRLSKLGNALLADTCASASSKAVDVKSAKKNSSDVCCVEECQHNLATLCPVYRFRRSICYAVRFWIRQFPVHFDLDSKLSTIMKDWQRNLAKTSKPGTGSDGERGSGSEGQQSCSYSELALLIDLGCLPSYDWIRNISVRDPSVKHYRKVSLVFNHLEPRDLANHLTYLEHRIMRRISFQDYKQYAVSGLLSECPRLERSVNLFNGLTQWVQCMVLSRSTPQQRAEVIVKLIDVTKILKDQRNFNSLMAIVGGLSHSSLARLSRTVARIPADTQRTLTDLTEFLSSSANFSNYRRALHECKGFKIPILGVHMKDLISLHVALSDVVEGGLINFRKMAQLSLIFQELQELQNATPPPGANMDLVNTLRVSLELAYTEDEIYELSLAREPRDSSSPQASPTRPSLLGEWPHSGPSNNMQTLTPNFGSTPLTHCDGLRSPLASSQTLPPLVPTSTDVCTLRVMNTVENDDDLNRQQLQSFPLADTTGLLQLEDTMNNEAEVFITPPHETLKLVQSSPVTLNDFATAPTATLSDAGGSVGIIDGQHHLKHDFYETSSFRPCTCAHCNGLLWGPLRQNYKCRECGLSAHKMCKDVMSLVCRPKTLNSSPFTDSLQSGSGSGKIHFRRRKKLSSHSDVEALESGLMMTVDCCCALNCPSPCNRSSKIGSSPQQPECQSNDSLHHDQFATKSSLPRSASGVSRVEMNNPSTCPMIGQLSNRSPKRQSLVATSNQTSESLGAVASVTSPVPIRQRKSSLSSFTGPCRSFPGAEPSNENPERISLSTSPRRKVNDTLHLIGSHKVSSCPCHGHH